MSVLDVIRLLFAVAFLVALPGYVLARALFPTRPLGPAQLLYVVIAGGVLLTMLVASILGFLPHGEHGALRSIFLGGLPNLEVAMLAVCVLLFWVGAYRGAYPALVLRYPQLAAPWSVRAGDDRP